MKGLSFVGFAVPVIGLIIVIIWIGIAIVGKNINAKDLVFSKINGVRMIDFRGSMFRSMSLTPLIRDLPLNISGFNIAASAYVPIH